MQTFLSFRSASLRLFLLVGAILLLPACEEEKGANALPAAEPPQVGFRTIQPQTVRLTTELPGRTVAYRKAEVRPQVNGIIQKRLFEEGASVEAGQPLYQIDPASFEAALKAAEAKLMRAQASLDASTLRVERYAQLVTRRAVSQQEYDDRLAEQAVDRAEVAAAEAELESARIDLRYTVVTAPIAGRIGRSNITEGALVTANQEEALAIITQLDPIYVDLSQSSAELLRARLAIETGEIVLPGGSDGGIPVELMIDATGSRYSHHGQIQFAEVLVDETTGSVSLRAVFPNPEHELMPGLFVRAIVTQGEVKDAFQVPQAAVARGNDGEAFIWVIGEDNIVKRRPVSVRRALATSWLVTGGLSGGERIVVDGLQRVRPDLKVTPVAVDPQHIPMTVDGNQASS